MSELTRRDLLIGGGALAATGAIMGIRKITQEHPQPIPSSPTTPQETATITSETATPELQPQGTPQTIQETITPETEIPHEDPLAKDLVSSYGPSMDETYFQSEQEKMMFMTELKTISEQINSENKNLPHQLAAVIAVGTDGTFSPRFRNPVNGAVGLFQFTEKTSPHTSLDDIAELSPMEQLHTIEDYLKTVDSKYTSLGFPPLWDVGDLLMASINPQAISEKDDTPIFSGPTVPYSAYEKFDSNKDYEITKQEAKEALIKEVNEKYHVEKSKLKNLKPKEEEQTATPTASPETPTPEPTATLESTSTPTPEPTSISTPEPTQTPLSDSTQTPTLQPTEIETPEPTETPSPTPTETETPEAENGSEKSRKEKTIEKNAQYLVSLYGHTMTSDHYPSEEYKIDFMKELGEIAYELNKDNPYLVHQMAAVINFESGFSPNILNQAGSGATGLIQFMPDVAPLYGVSTQELAVMNPLDQLSFVKAYFEDKQNTTQVKMNDIYDTYMAVLYPDAMGKEKYFVLFRNDPMNARDAYDQNSGLDINGDGVITKEEASQVVVSRALNCGEKNEHLYKEEKEKSSSENETNESKILEKFKKADADKEIMEKLVKASQEVVKELDDTTYEFGWCLKGVQDALEQIGLPVYDENPDGSMKKDSAGNPIRPGSAYQMISLLSNDKRFGHIKIDKDELPYLPPGAVVVWEGDPNSPADDGMVDGKHVDHGHIEIVWGNGVRASSFVNDGSQIEGILELSSPFEVFAPKLPPEKRDLGTQSPKEHNGVKLETLEQYQEAIKDKFDVILIDFTDPRYLEYAWELLHKTRKTNYPDLIKGVTIQATQDTGSIQISDAPGQVNVKFGLNMKNDLVHNTRAFQAWFLHETGHVIYHKDDKNGGQVWERMQNIYKNKGAISNYGEVGANDYPDNDVRKFGENFADLLMYYFLYRLYPTFEFVSNDASKTTQNPFYDKEKTKEYKNLIEDLLFD